tara:strand:+ start:466 stop:807 length:342 start_codon:yes stop_codon:yes gene_type:complete
MGAHDCTVLKIGRYRDANEAYAEAVVEAENQYGWDGYNGTISTSEGFKIIKKHPRYGTKAWEKFADKTIEGTKWKAWNCIEIKGAILKRMKEQQGYKDKRNIKAFYFWGLAAS